VAYAGEEMSDFSKLNGRGVGGGEKGWGGVWCGDLNASLLRKTPCDATNEQRLKNGKKKRETWKHKQSNQGGQENVGSKAPDIDRDSSPSKTALKEKGGATPEVGQHQKETGNERKTSQS